MRGGSPPTSKDSTPSPFERFPSCTSEDKGSNRPVDVSALDGPREQDNNTDTADTFRFSPRSATKLSLQHLHPSLLEHEVRQGSFDSLKSTNDEHKSRPATSRAGNTVGSVHSAARVRHMGAPTISSGTPLEMLRRKAHTEKMQRIEAVRASVKQRLHIYTASVAFKQLSGAEQVSFWVGSSQGPPNLSKEYANATRECRGDVPHTPPAAQSKAWKSWAMDPEDDLFRVGSGW